MTRDEIKVAIKNILTNGSDADIYEEILDTIFAALKEPTEEMMKTIGATSVQRLVWHKMLSASPLAPKEK